MTAGTGIFIRLLLHGPAFLGVIIVLWEYPAAAQIIDGCPLYNYALYDLLIRLALIQPLNSVLRSFATLGGRAMLD